ncbi:MAG: TonB-dependent receptor, partial [Chitinophagaceae bacterium]|nr:TonB-dependent receptor [Chitinophagaceae bacterium]
NGNQSWGPKLSSPAKDDRLSAFYVNGHNFTNAVNFSAGSDRAQTYFSYANTSANGVMPTNSLNRHNLTFRETGRFLDDKLTLDVNVNYINQKVHNTPPHGLWLNPVIGLYVFPVGTDITHYKDNYAVPDPARNGLLTQNWVVNEDVQSNPWWIMYKDPNFSTRHRMIINASAKYEFNNWLNLQARGNMDRASDTWEQDLYAGTNPVNSPGSNGSFKRSDQTFTQTYGDVMLNFKTPAKAGFRVDGLLGASITDQNTVGTNYGAGNGLSIPNIFILQNVIASANSPVSTMAPNHNQIQSVFGNANFSYKEWIFLDITGRNDWSSNLSFTSNKSYFYSSAGLSVILNQVIKLPDFMTYAKVRGSYAEVATTVPPYITHPINSLAGGGAVNFNNVEPNPELKPTNTNSIEAGADLRFIDNRLSLNFTWYKSNTHNQFIRYTPAPSTGYSVGYLNAGNIKNTGVEVVLSYDVLKGRDFTWTSGLNYSTNKNTILALDPSSPNSPIFLT